LASRYKNNYAWGLRSHIAKNAFNATIKDSLIVYVANNIITALDEGESAAKKNLAIELSKSAAGSPSGSARAVLVQRKINPLLGEFFTSPDKKRVEKDKPANRVTKSQGPGLGFPPGNTTGRNCWNSRISNKEVLAADGV